MTIYYRDVIRYDESSGAFSIHVLLVEDDDASFNSVGLDPGDPAVAYIDGVDLSRFETLTSGHILQIDTSSSAGVNLSCIRFDNEANGFSYFIPSGGFNVEQILAIKSYVPGSDPVFGTAYSAYGLTSARAIGTANAEVIAIGGTDDVISTASSGDTVYGLDGDDVITIPGLVTVFGGDGRDVLSFDTVPLYGVQADMATGSAHRVNQAGNSYHFYEIEEIVGSIYDDRLYGNADENTLSGSDGNDYIEGRAGADTLDGGGGLDILSYASSNEGVSVSLAEGTARNGHAEGDVFVNFEHLTGSNYDDTLTGSGFNNWVAGLDGDDTLIAVGSNTRLKGGAGADTLIGFNESTVADYSGASFIINSVTINLATGQIEGDEATGDVFINISSVKGANGDDFLTGNELENKLHGEAGRDVIEGGAGGDVLNGGFGYDLLSYRGSSAGVTVNLHTRTASGGDAEGDSIFFFEDLFGSDFNDSLTGTYTQPAPPLLEYVGSYIFGFSGDDIIYGGYGQDTLDGGADNDTLSYELSTAGVNVDIRLNTASGGYAGVSITEIDIISNFENLTGSDFDDTLTGNNDDNVLAGGFGADRLEGGGGADTLSGGEQDDVLNGQGNHDSLMGGGGIDTLSGGTGHDMLFGDSGDDSLNGGTGLDLLDGGEGDDTLNGSADGMRDIFVFRAGYDSDRVNGFEQAGSDRLQLDDDLWTAVYGSLTKAEVVTNFAALNAAGTIVTFDFGNGDILRVQNSAGLDMIALSADIQII